MRNLALVAVLAMVAGGAFVFGQPATTVPAAGTTVGTAAATAPAASAPASAPSAFKTEKERIGYAIGLQIGSKLKGVDVDGAALAAGVKDASTGAKQQMSDEELREAVMALQKQMMAAHETATAANQKKGEDFLTENGKKEGVKTTASGLQYKVIKSGNGKTPKATDTVSVNYRGTLTSGKEFDASNGKPVSFPVNRVIPGWTEALQLMKEGDKWMLYIPSKLAYAERGAGEDIGPNETLIFEVELLKVQ
jgi:FKBP-type peptidyl-prolyl cis-trans isomerase FklB